MACPVRRLCVVLDDYEGGGSEGNCTVYHNAQFRRDILMMKYARLVLTNDMREAVLLCDEFNAKYTYHLPPKPDINEQLSQIKQLLYVSADKFEILSLPPIDDPFYFLEHFRAVNSVMVWQPIKLQRTDEPQEPVVNFPKISCVGNPLHNISEMEDEILRCWKKVIEYEMAYVKYVDSLNEVSKVLSDLIGGLLQI